MRSMDESIPIFTHGAIENTNQVMRRQGVQAAQSQKKYPTNSKEDYMPGIVIAPPSAISAPWIRKFSPPFHRHCLRMDDPQRRPAAAPPTAVSSSDHADWKSAQRGLSPYWAPNASSLPMAIPTSPLAERRTGLDAVEAQTEFEGELSEDNETEE